MVFEEDGSRGDVPLDVVGEHAEEDVGAHPVLAPVVDGSEEFDGLEAAEGALDAGEVLVGADGLRGVEAFGFDIGADDVDACEGGFGADHVLVALEGKEVSVIWWVELAHLAVDDLSEAGADLVLAAEGRLLPLGGSAMRWSSFSVDCSGVSGAARRQAWGSDDEALAGVFVGGDLEQVALLEQGGGRPLGVEELADHGLAEGGDPAQPLDALEVLADAGGGEHAPVADHHQPLDAEGGLELLELAGETVWGSVVFPGKTSTATGRPSGSVSSPMTIWSLPCFLSRL